MNSTPIRILLADDDNDDCTFFAKALNEIPIAATLAIVHDGEELMKYLTENTARLPDVLFLDLSMPRKTGFECLAEIKENEKLKDLHVIMLSTSYARDMNFEQGLINTLSKMGSEEFIRKPSDYEQLKQLIHQSIKKVINKKLHNL